VYYRHNYTKTPEESVRDVLTATTDVDCGPFVPLFVTSALKKGLVSMQLIEARLRNLFRVRFRLAHFDPQSPLNFIPLSEVCSEAGQRLARDGVTQSAVLLKNSGNALPFISRSASYAVIGPNSNLSAAIAGYYGPSSVCGNNFWTLYDAVAQYTSAPPLYAPGCPSVLSANLSLVAAAAKLAGSVDRVVLALGTDLTWAAEGLDATSIVFSRGQAALWRAVAEAARAPIVVVILTATPLDLTDLLAHPKVRWIASFLILIFLSQGWCGAARGDAQRADTRHRRLALWRRSAGRTDGADGAARVVRRRDFHL
jgi:beta-D-xylosidase 4